MTAQQLKGRYEFRSPYHKTKKMLPFVVTGETTYDKDYLIEVQTVQYRGWDAEYITTGYTVQEITEKIKSGFLTQISKP